MYIWRTRKPYIQNSIYARSVPSQWLENKLIKHKLVYKFNIRIYVNGYRCIKCIRCYNELLIGLLIIKYIHIVLLIEHRYRMMQ